MTTGDPSSDSSEPHRLLEHFFRHQYGRIVSVLSRWFGVQHLDRIEEAVQTSLQRALHHWARHGVPPQPEGWLYRTAQRILLDQLRREKRHFRFADLDDAPERQQTDAAAHELADETLRLLFLCCHPSIPVPSQVAFALKVVGGFSVPELARALLTQEENVQKRLERARHQLQTQQLELESLHHPWMKQRVQSVQAVIYLIFNEGYLPTAGDQPIQQQLCQEALRLGQLLADHSIGKSADTCALMALMNFHAARQAARQRDGQLVLLEDQDRRLWDTERIASGLYWMGQMTKQISELPTATGNASQSESQGGITSDDLSIPGRYALEAAIAWEHLRAADVTSTHWKRLVNMYRLLCRQVPGPAQYLNLAIAESKVLGPAAGLNRLQQFPADRLPRPYALWDAVQGDLLSQMGRKQEAIQCLDQALASTTNQVERQLLQAKRDRLA